MQLDAWNWEDAAYKADDGIHLSWPSSMRRGRWWLGEAPGYTPNKEYNKNVDRIKDFVRNARAYGSGEGEKNLAFEAMQGVLNGSQGLFVTANAEMEIRDVIAFKKAMNIPQLVLVGGYQANQVTQELVAHNIP